jgi:predicted nuclease of predicted toxin-antitoxin system
MTLVFYMDVQVHGSITNGLRSRGVDVLTAQEDGFDETPDDEVLNRATALGRVLVTYDHDFLVETHERQLAGMDFAGIVFSHQE